MIRRPLGDTDLRVSEICYGAAGFGSLCKGADLDALLKIYRDAGGNFIDTAHCYAFWLPEGSGCSERALGDYLKRNGKGDLVIGTKGAHSSEPGYRVTEAWLSPGRVAADIDDSLGRLGLDALDVFWLHRDDPRVPVGEVLELLNAEWRRGRIRWFGVSNWHPERRAAAHAYARAQGLRGFSASQPEWNLAQKNGLSAGDDGLGTGREMRGVTAADRVWHRETRMPMVPYSSTAGGYFASGGEKSQAAYDNAVSRGRLERTRTLAAELGVTPGQIALAWLMNQDFPVFPIIGCLGTDHLREDLGACGLRLSPRQVQWLEDPSG
jgi:aryl-alcohol dehydrogenase-like predicted oxidoreductase